jgi:hypothetical protein
MRRRLPVAAAILENYRDAEIIMAINANGWRVVKKL